MPVAPIHFDSDFQSGVGLVDGIKTNLMLREEPGNSGMGQSFFHSHVRFRALAFDVTPGVSSKLKGALPVLGMPLHHLFP
jgi:hypothetical protein